MSTHAFFLNIDRPAHNPSTSCSVLWFWIEVTTSKNEDHTQDSQIKREYLLFDNFYQPLTSVKLNQRLNSIFNGKKISTNNFRHSYLTEKFGNNYQEMKDTATMMGTSVGTIQGHYIKSSYN